MTNPEPFDMNALGSTRGTYPVVCAPARPADLPSLWRAFFDARLTLRGQGVAGDGRYVVFRVNPEMASRVSFNRSETAILGGVLGGDQQKFVASELGIACSTASKWFTSAMRKLLLDAGPVPLPLVLAAQASAGKRRPSIDARSDRFVEGNVQHLILTVPRPSAARADMLTEAEKMVALMLIEGDRRSEIARRRQTSAQTVACQMRSVYSKLGATGRYALVARAVDLGWFSQGRP